MPLVPGSRLGPYEVVGAIGAGGMGEVYRARDTKLNRDVALKVLPEAFALDADRLARFKREAQVLASLNHPHIVHIYGLEGLDRPEGHEGISAFIAMELVDGEDLAERLRRGPLPLDEALPIARQIAEALEAAHEQGVVHRDLKPANIKLRSDGIVKVLDFGLAKAFEQSSASHSGERSVTVSPTITTPAMTQMGMILGTAAYMSPEQAKGRPADKRSDVWSFGCVLFEMLTGKRPFEGEDVSDTLAAVLRGEPEWSALPSETPAPVRALIQQCLVKDRRQRVGDLSVARFVLAAPASLGAPLLASTTAIAPSIQRRRWDPIVRVAAAVVVTAAVVGGAAWRFRPAPTTLPVVRLPITLPAGQLFSGVARHFVAISPDGSHMVYSANNRLYLRSLSEFEAHAIPGTDSIAVVPVDPVFSPDGGAIAFFADVALKRVALTGGAAMTICPENNAPFGVTWDTSGIVFAASARGIFRCPSNGGTPEQLITVKDGEQAQSPSCFRMGRRCSLQWARSPMAPRAGTRQRS
jgi:eukaryotic-like serine/threonine-protein kinase